MSPRQSKQNQRNSAKSPEAIESALAAQRAQLIGDVEALSARLAPQALTSMARRSAQATAAEWRNRASKGTARLKARVGLVKDDPPGAYTHLTLPTVRRVCVSVFAVSL